MPKATENPHGSKPQTKSPKKTASVSKNKSGATHGTPVKGVRIKAGHPVKQPH